MDHRVIIIIFAGALLSVSSAQTRQFYFVNTPLNWRDAQSVCRQNYADLATIENTADVDAAIVALSNYTGKTWIGLHDDMLNSWRWSLSDSSFYGDGESTYWNWYPGEPNNYDGQQLCVHFYGAVNDLWDNYCSVAYSFVCYTGTVAGTPSYIFINTPLNWTDAQKYCRQNYVDLASIRNITEKNIIKDLSLGHTVWIGLYRQKVWSDGSQSVFQYNIDIRQDSTGDQCVSVEKPGQWSNNDCSSQFPFLCYKIALLNVEFLRSIAQDQSSITLQWNKITNDISFVLLVNGVERSIATPSGDGPVNYTVSSLSARTNYNFTLFSVFGNVRSSGVQVSVATAPQNAENFRASAQTETSITLEWSRMNTNVSFILQFNGTETNISAPEGGGPVSYTVTSLTARTEYTFTLSCVVEGIRSSGVSVTAFTGPNTLVQLNMSLSSLIQQSDSDLNEALTEFFRKNCSLQQFSLRIVKVDESIEGNA